MYAVCSRVLVCVRARWKVVTEGGAQSRGLPAVPAGPASSANSPCAQALATTPRIAQERLVQGQGAWQSAAPAGRCTHERTAGEGAAACCGVVGVRAAHRQAADVAWRTREVPWQRRCFSASRCASLWSRRRDCDRWDAPAVPRQLQAGWDFSGTGVWSRWGPAKQRGHGSGRAVVARACEHACMHAIKRYLMLSRYNLPCVSQHWS